MNADGLQDRFLTIGHGGARWSPDGSRILYLGEAEGHAQIFVRWTDVDGSGFTQVTQAVNKIGDARWSPDGRSIAFSMFTPEPPKWTISLPAAPKDAKWTGAPRIVDSLHYRQDQTGLLDDGQHPSLRRACRRRLFHARSDARQSGASVRAAARAAWASTAWTPDSRTIVVQASKDFDNDEAYERSQLLAVDVATGAARDLVTTKGSWNEPLVSPDGKTIAFAGYPEGKRTHIGLRPLAYADRRR